MSVIDPYTKLFNALNEAKIAAEDLMIQRNAAQNRARVDYARGHSDGHGVGYDEGYTDAKRAHPVEGYHGLARGSA